MGNIYGKNYWIGGKIRPNLCFVIFGKQKWYCKTISFKNNIKKKNLRKIKGKKKATYFVTVFTIFSSKNSKEKILQFFIFLWLKTAAQNVHGPFFLLKKL